MVRKGRKCAVCVNRIGGRSEQADVYAWIDGLRREKKTMLMEAPLVFQQMIKLEVNWPLILKGAPCQAIGPNLFRELVAIKSNAIWLVGLSWPLVLANVAADSGETRSTPFPHVRFHLDSRARPQSFTLS